MRFLALFLWCASALAATADCDGRDLRQTLTEAERTELAQAVADTPYPEGNHWLATRGDARIHLIGTIHLDDPRLAARVETLTPAIEAAKTVLFEMTASDQQALQEALTTDPEMLVLRDTTLPEIMPEADWQRLAEAAEARGIPGFMAAKFQPWYLSMVLSIPPCMMATMTEAEGLDARLQAVAQEADKRTAALEDYRSVFAVFNDAPLEDQAEMLTAAIVDPALSSDMFTTLLASYFDEATAEGWEMSRLLSLRAAPENAETVNESFAEMEETLVFARNRAWLPVILEAAQDGPVTVAAGAAHLPGEAGLLKLLAEEGFTLARQPF